jgi:alpha-galactosidase
MYQSSEILRSRPLVYATLSLVVLLLSGCVYDEPIRIHSDDLRLEFDHRLYSRIVAVDPASGATKSLGPFSPTETLATENEEYSEFQTDSQEWTEVSDAIGEGQRVVLAGRNSVFRKQVEISTYADFPGTAILRVTYTNVSEEPLTLKSWANNRYRFNSEGASEPGFWSFQGGSYESRPDWVLPVESGFSQQNFQGMNATDYGGGVPISDVWRKDIGIGVGHLAQTPKQTSLPVECRGTSNGSTTKASRPSYGGPPWRWTRAQNYQNNTLNTSS